MKGRDGKNTNSRFRFQCQNDDENRLLRLQINDVSESLSHIRLNGVRIYHPSPVMKIYIKA